MCCHVNFEIIILHKWGEKLEEHVTVAPRLIKWLYFATRGYMLYIVLVEIWAIQSTPKMLLNRELHCRLRRVNTGRYKVFTQKGGGGRYTLVKGCYSDKTGLVQSRKVMAFQGCIPGLDKSWI